MAGGMILLHLPTLLLLVIFYPSNPFLPTITMCFLIITVTVNGLLQFTSLWLDWRNDCWVRGLVRQLVEAQAAELRCEAAEKLSRLGKWARGAKPAIESALQDADERVRTRAQEVLAQLP